MSGRKALDIVRKWGLVIVIIIMFVFFALNEKSFSRFDNIINILRQTSIMGILAIGLTFVVVSGEMDLSFSSIVSLSSILVMLMCQSSVNSAISWAIVIVLGLLLGLFNGFVVVRLRIPSLLGTIATQLAFGGVVAWLCNGGTVWTARHSALFTFPGRGILFGFLPFQSFLMIVIAIIALIVLERTVLGRHFYAVGGNARAADHAGINAKRIKYIAYIIMGGLAAVAGIVVVSQFVSTTPVIGATYLFPAIIAVYLGSIFLKDGVPNLWGTIIACLFLAMISNGFILIGLKYWHENVTQGIIMIIAIASMQAGKKRKH